MDEPIVTLTTDWGNRDFFAAMVKGRLCSLIPGVRILDLSHTQMWNDPATTIGIIRYGCSSFPEGTVHIVDVGCDRMQVDGRQAGFAKPLLVSYKGQYIICSDRKLLEQSLDDACDEVVELVPPESLRSFSFLARDLYCDVVRQLVSGMALSQLGVSCEPLRRRVQPQAQLDGNELVAMVTGIDSYGNADLNINYDDFETLRAGRRFKVKIEWRIGSNDRFEDISGICRHYSDVRMGNILLTVSVTGRLQIAINKGSAVQLIGLRYASRCHFFFE
ncbi:MAG: SAM-dependent chlorinase/fluorinase [Bacteroidales bacterium]|nr:SAM-dependent chlorinase/fluorinase [Bacteroidales bacterium]